MSKTTRIQPSPTSPVETPHLLPRGVDRRELSSTIRPQDDLYHYMNDEWINTHELAQDKAIDGAFHQLHDLSERQCKEIIEQCSSGYITEGKAHEIKLLFDAYMNTDRIETDGLQPLLSYLSAIHKVSTIEEFTQIIAKLFPYGDSPLPACGVTINPHDPCHYIFSFSQGGLGLPDESYYREETYAPILKAYKDYLCKLFTLISADDKEYAYDRPDNIARRILDYETSLARTHWDRVTMRDTDKTTTIMSWQQLSDICPSFNWDMWAHEADIPIQQCEKVMVACPDHLSGLSSLWNAEHLDVLKDWLIFHIVNGYASVLPQRYVDARFDFYGKVLTGTQQLRPRWKRGVGCVENSLGEPLGKLYVARHFPPEDKAAMEKLVSYLLSAYRESITCLQWMSEKTKQEALKKLSSFVTKIGYPDRWRDYSSLVFDDIDSIVTMLKKVALWEHRDEIARLGEKVDRYEWYMTPQTVNAYYNPTQNEIVFPAAILQPPFFDSHAHAAQNFGAIGAVIGHEIGHGFDDQGAKFDAQGRIHNWWNKDDEEKFHRLTQSLIDYYNTFSPSQLSDEHKVNGALTIGENIGDLGGLTIAYQAWLRYMREEEHSDDPPVEEKQLFFFSWARIWRTQVRNEYALQLLAIDPHSPAEFRCNGVVAHSDAFAEAFQLTTSDQLWIDPTKRVHIW